MKIRYKTHKLVVPLNAMSDVAFILLIFIMVVSLINYQKTVPIEFANVDSAQEVKSDKSVSIWIDVDGALYIDGDSATFENVQTALTDIYKLEPSTRIHITADKNTEFKNVNSIIEILQILEYSVVSFVVRDEK
ncbi:MAG: hypothetical protein Ta2B_26830 [Termitinemataceae bacterium]|nr:MAG: hypothetical protein Ta2B_26830 [Termitinemataceae bacterium]